MISHKQDGKAGSQSLTFPPRCKDGKWLVPAKRHAWFSSFQAHNESPIQLFQQSSLMGVRKTSFLKYLDVHHNLNTPVLMFHFLDLKCSAKLRVKQPTNIHCSVKGFFWTCCQNTYLDARVCKGLCVLVFMRVCDIVRRVSSALSEENVNAGLQQHDHSAAGRRGAWAPRGGRSNV